MKARWKDFTQEELELASALIRGPDELRCPPPEFISAALSEVLPEQLAAQVNHHVAGCPDCQALRDAWLDPDMASPSDPERLRIRRRIQAGMRPARKPLWARWSFLAAAGACAALTIAILLQVSRREALMKPAPVATTAQIRPAFVLPFESPELKLPSSDAVLWRGEEAAGRQAYLKDLGAAFEPYRRGDWTAAAERFQALAARFPQQPEAPFYRAICMLQLGRAEEAIALLEQAKRLQPAHLKDDLDWYLSVAWERHGDPERAKQLLQGLCQSKGAYQARACDGLSRLR